MSSFDFVNGARVGMNSLLLEVAHESVDKSRREEVENEERVEEDALCTDDHELHEATGFAHLHKCEEMHALVVRLLEERLDEAIVSLHPSQAAQVAKHSTYHTWHAGYRLKENEPNQLISVNYATIFFVASLTH